MKTLLFTGALALLMTGCGVDGEPVRESGVEPPEVATSVIEDADTEPSRPTGTLF